MSDKLTDSFTLVGVNSTISANNPPSGGSFSYSSIIPAYDTDEPRPKVRYKKVQPRKIVITCRCGGKLQCKSGTTIGYSTTWDNKCPKCHAVYQMKEQAGNIVYE